MKISDDQLLNLCEKLFETGNYSISITTLRTVLELLPDDIGSLFSEVPVKTRIFDPEEVADALATSLWNVESTLLSVLVSIPNSSPVYEKLTELRLTVTSSLQSYDQFSRECRNKHVMS